MPPSSAPAPDNVKSVYANTVATLSRLALITNADLRDPHFVEQFLREVKDVLLDWECTTAINHPGIAPVPAPDTLTSLFRAADAKDWDHLFAALPHSAHGKFWSNRLQAVQRLLTPPA